MADVEPRASELVTANYGWTKPNVGDSDDAWGGMINADLDGIDSTVKSVSNAIPAASSTTPVMDGTAAIGVGTTWARADHVHASDTSRYAASNPSGFQTAAQVTTSLGSYLALTGGTLTGAMTLAADPAANLQPVTLQYLNARPMIGDNKIINGDMRIDARNNGSSGTAGGYTVDRWTYSTTQASKGVWQRGPAGVGLVTAGFGYFLGFTSTTAYASVASDQFAFLQPIEADMIADLAWGTLNAQPVTLSFWVNFTLTGTFSGAIRNQPSPATRSYPFTFSIPTANTWTKVVVTIPGDTAGTWVMSGSAAGLQLGFDLGCGSTFRGPGNAWASANYFGATGSVSTVAVNGAAFALTGVKLEIGSVATSFNRQSLAKSLADCQRYYSTAQGWFMGNATAAGVYYAQGLPPVTMRATPTITASPVGSFSGFPNTIGTLSVSANGLMSDGRVCSATTTGAIFYSLFAASAEL